jgi:hypothetical protein
MRNISPNKSPFNSLELDKIEVVDPPKWIVPTLATSWFLGLIILFWMYAITDILLIEIVKWFTLFSLLFTLIPYKWTVKILPVEFHFMIVLNVVGLGPLFTGLFMFINFLFAANPVSEIKNIISYHHGKEAFNTNDIVLELEDEALENQMKFRSFPYPDYIVEVKQSSKYQYTVKDGLFGYEVLTDYGFK